MRAPVLSHRIIISLGLAAALVGIGARNFAQHPVAYWIIAPANLIMPVAYIASWIHPFLAWTVMLTFDVLVYAVALFLLLPLVTQVQKRSASE